MTLSRNQKIGVGVVIVALALWGGYRYYQYKKAKAAAGGSGSGGSGSGGSGSGGSGGGSGNSVTYFPYDCMTPDKPIGLGAQDSLSCDLVVRTQKLINDVRTSLGQNKIPEDGKFSQVTKEALQYATSLNGKGIDGQSLSTITLAFVQNEILNPNRLKPFNANGTR
jgi:hypothetical protein